MLFDTAVFDASRQLFGRSFDSTNLPEKATACRNAQIAWRAARHRHSIRPPACPCVGARALLRIALIVHAPLVPVVCTRGVAQPTLSTPLSPLAKHTRVTDRLRDHTTNDLKKVS